MCLAPEIVAVDVMGGRRINKTPVELLKYWSGGLDMNLERCWGCKVFSRNNSADFDGGGLRMDNWNKRVMK